MQINPLLSRFGVTLPTAIGRTASGWPASGPAAPGGLTAASGTAASAGGQFSEASFMTLLTTELQAQDPSNPLDPNQFVNQLVQFNVLDQLIQIRSLLAGSGGPSAGVQASNATSSKMGPTRSGSRLA
jgi:flagellar basal-body rod modification protein FlgD